jgi:hypothetical protein
MRGLPLAFQCSVGSAELAVQESGREVSGDCGANAAEQSGD